jgi:hypothetical protein
MFWKLTESFLSPFCLGYAEVSQRRERDKCAGGCGSTKRFSARDSAVRTADAPGEVVSFHTFLLGGVISDFFLIHRKLDTSHSL